MQYNSNLIFDVGFHQCEDIDFYLSTGYNVLGIDADYSNVKNAEIRYREQIKTKQLILEHCAITEDFEDDVDFYQSQYSHWSSLNKKIATRKNLPATVVAIQGKPLSYFMQAYGIPFYCKIDIEGSDIIALQSLEGFERFPKYISVETECIGEKDILSDDEILETLIQLHKLGYNQFKLIDQDSLHELRPDCQFYGILSNVNKKTLLSQNLKYSFKKGSSGPFGELLGDRWLSYDDAIKTLLFHRKHFFNSGNKVNYAFWCDWHATFGNVINW
jgi:hypothetical protein